MQFEEVSHFIKHGKVPPIDEHNIDALGVASPFYPALPCPQPIATTTQHNKKKHTLTAKLVSTVRHRLQKSTSTTSDDDDDDGDDNDNNNNNNQTNVNRRRYVAADRQGKQQQQQQSRRTGRHHPLFQRLKKKHAMISSTPGLVYSSSGEELDGGYLSFDDVQQQWRKQRRRILRRPATLVPVQLQHQHTHKLRGMDDNNNDDDPMFLMAHGDLRRINDQMKQFRVPADWAILDDPPPLSPMSPLLPMPAKHSITAKRMMTDLTARIEQYNYLCVQEQKRIQMNKQAIDNHMMMLRELDRKVEVLAASIGHARTEKSKRMAQMLRDTQRRSPYLLDAHAIHKKTVGSIEGYLRSMNYASHLAELRLKVDRMREYQVIWSQVQQWVPSLVISLVVVILISYFSAAA